MNRIADDERTGVVLNIGQICWPEQPEEAIALYLRYLIKVVRHVGIEFPPELPNPIATAEAFAAGTIDEQAYDDAASKWWKHVDDAFGPRDLESPAALSARVALSLLSARHQEAPRLADHLSWFFEVLGFLGHRLAEPITIMDEHFESL